MAALRVYFLVFTASCVFVAVLLSVLLLTAKRKNSTMFMHDSAFPMNRYLLLQEPYRSYPCLPRRIHLSQASDVDDNDKVSMTVSFSLDYHQCQHVTPYVHYTAYHSDGESSEKRQATAFPLQFNYTSEKDGEYFVSDWLYHVVLTDLLAETLYEYYIEVEKDGTNTTSTLSRRRRLLQVVAHTPTLSFRTPPLRSSPTTIAVVGDVGQTINSTLTMANIYSATFPIVNEQPISLLMIVGDMSYADSDPNLWTSWFDLMEPLLTQTPLHVAVGNHEIECDKVTHMPFVQYEHYFRNPNRMEPVDIQPLTPAYIDTLESQSCSAPSVFHGDYSYGNSFYAFQHGLVMMVVLNSYTRSHADSVQYKWLEQEFQKVNRSITPWLVVSFHSPIYNTFKDHVNESEAIEMQLAMEPLFVQHNVNLVVSGHCHAYMRTKPLAFNHVNESGPVYVIVGAGGNREGHASGYQHDTPEEWIAKRDDVEFGYGRLHFANATHVQWSWVRDGTTTEGVRDDVWIVNRYYG
jgi:hypothetical protein